MEELHRVGDTELHPPLSFSKPRVPPRLPLAQSAGWWAWTTMLGEDAAHARGDLGGAGACFPLTSWHLELSLHSSADMEAEVVCGDSKVCVLMSAQRVGIYVFLYFLYFFSTSLFIIYLPSPLPGVRSWLPRAIWRIIMWYFSLVCFYDNDPPIAYRETSRIYKLIFLNYIAPFLTPGPRNDHLSKLFKNIARADTNCTSHHLPACTKFLLYLPLYL